MVTTAQLAYRVISTKSVLASLHLELKMISMLRSLTLKQLTNQGEVPLKQLIEKSIQFNNLVYIAFIDFTKAFDRIKLDCLWRLLEKTNINKRYIRLLKSTYDNSTASIKTDIGIFRPVKILKGVKQGDILSALLFCIVIATFILEAESECKSGFSIGGQLLSNLTYADDIAATNRSQRELQTFLDCLVKYSSEVGLHINVSKTECMTTAKNHTLHLTVNGKQIKQVNDFVYLGHKLSRGTALIGNSVRDFFITKGFVRIFHGFLLKTIGFLPKVYEIIWK